MGEGGDLGGGVEALEQFGGGLGRLRGSGAADEKAVRRVGQRVADAIGCGEAAWAAIQHHHQIATDSGRGNRRNQRNNPGPGQPQPCSRRSKQQGNQHLRAHLTKRH